jgi:hypothetical protein
MPQVAHKRLADAAHVRDKVVAQICKLGEGQLDGTPFIAVRPPESMLMVGTKGKPKGVLAGAFPDFGQYVREPRPAGCPESVKAVRHDEIAIVLKDNDRREAVATHHCFGILPYDAIVNVSTSLRPGIKAD